MITKSNLLKDTDKMMEVDESWREGSLAERNLHMLDSQLMTDCTFVVGITEKKFVLCQGSSVFYAMFNGGLKEKGDVKVEDIEPQHFRKMIDNTDLGNVESALSVCYAANKYMINTLILKCIDFIKKNLNEEIVCKTLEFARLIDNADLEADSLQCYDKRKESPVEPVQVRSNSRAPVVKDDGRILAAWQRLSAPSSLVEL
ncbi:hypothetical protein B566_EDAN007027 [Ephemera danica]|nr:hypothetical protein B566_EDAN007027 [Ephemera danica]